jgi:hypothetical protein
MIDAVPASSRDAVDGIKAYYVADSIDTEYVWRLSIPQELYGSLKQSFEVEEFSGPDAADSFWHKPPGWWDPDPRAGGEYLLWSDFFQNGFQVITLYDRKNEVLYGWAQNDFYDF